MRRASRISRSSSLLLFSQSKGIGFPDFQAGYNIGSNITFTASQDGIIYTDVYNGDEVKIGNLKITVGDRGTSYIIKKGQSVYCRYNTYFIPFIK